MKIVCDSCSAKYSISDDKVQGKVFKIRCKKCSNIIVVKGNAGAAAAEEPAPAQLEKETRVYDYNAGADAAAAPAADDAVWHIVVDQDQVGPLTVDEVRQRYNAGQIDAETYAWREGFGDWLPLSQVDVFAAMIAGGGSGGGSEAVSSLFGGGGAAAPAASASFGGGDDGGTSRSDEGDLFRAKSGGSLADEDSDLFGSGGDADANAPAAASGAKLRGERNENSVLFSLNNLAALANNPAPKASAAPAASMGGGGGGGGGGSAQHGGGEGSGLIDIRSMANAYLADKGGPARPAAPAPGVGSIDDLPVFASTGFSEPAVIMPMVGGRSNSNNKVLYGLIAGVAVLAIVAIILVVKVLGSKKEVVVATNAPAGTVAKPNEPGKDPGTTPTPPTDNNGAAAATGSTGSTGAPAATGTTVATNDTPPPPEKDPGTATKPEPTKPDPATGHPATKPDPHATKPDPHATKPDPHTATTPTPVTPTKPTPTKPPADSGGSCDEVSCVLNNYEGACCAKYKKGGGTKPAPSGDLPESLDRGMITDGVGKVKGKVMSCGDRSSAKGTVKVSVKVGGDGKVASVSVKESPDPGLGNCVASAMQKASFAKTQNGGSFSYPFTF